MEVETISQSRLTVDCAGYRLCLPYPGYFKASAPKGMHDLAVDQLRARRKALIFIDSTGDKADVTVMNNTFLLQQFSNDWRK